MRRPHFGQPVKVGQGEYVHVRSWRLDETLCRLGGQFGGELRPVDSAVTCRACLARIGDEAERAA